MSLIGIISSEIELNTIIQDEFNRLPDDDYILRIPPDEVSILEFLNFDLPEIVIINFADKNLPLGELLSQIQDDSWLHNFGIIGIFDHEIQNEEDVLSQYQTLNILAMLDLPRLRSHIVRCAQIIEQNRQLIFQRDIEEKLVDKASGSFTIENDILATSVYASIAATSLLQRGYIKPEAKMHLQLCLAELMVNGVEHGNCGISFDEKTGMLDKDMNIVELVEQKCQNPEIARKRVHFEWEIYEDNTRFIIRDEGSGFDVRGLRKKIEEEGPLALHGRGIRMARAFAERLMYNKKGNMVVLIVQHDKGASKNAPAGFSGEEILHVIPGETIFKEGEGSDFLYYIASGKFTVYHKGQRVGSLGPEDIFMGEMSFLLSNKRSAEVRADTEGLLVKITRRSFVSVIKEYPHYGIFLSKLLARKLVRANIRNAELPDPRIDQL